MQNLMGKSLMDIYNYTDHDFQMLDRKILTDEQPLPCTCKHCKMLSKYFDSIYVSKFKISSIKIFAQHDIPILATVIS